MKIFKYPFDTAYPGIKVLSIPEGYEILSVGVSTFDELCVWACVDPQTTTKKLVKFELVWTGGTRPNGGFLGTVNHQGLIIHIFKLP